MSMFHTTKFMLQCVSTVIDPLWQMHRAEGCSYHLRGTFHDSNNSNYRANLKIHVVTGIKAFINIPKFGNFLNFGISVTLNLDTRHIPLDIF